MAKEQELYDYEIPAFERVEDHENRIYNVIFYWLGFRNGVRLPLILIGFLLLIALFVFMSFFPPSSENWMLYFVPPGLILYRLSKINTQGRSLNEYWAASLRYLFRPRVTMVGKEVQQKPIQFKQPYDLAQDSREV